MTLARRITGLQREAPAAFVPTDLASLVAWFDMSDISTLWTDTGRSVAVTSDTDIIKGVTNKATSPTYHLSEVTNGPQYKTAIQNGNSIARFDGSDDVLLTDVSIGADSSRTFVLVVKVRSAIAGGTKDVFAMGAVSQLYTNAGSHASGVNYYATAGSTEQLNVVPTATNWNIGVLRVNSAASLDVFANGGTPTNFNPDDEITTDLVASFGAYTNRIQGFLDVDVAEVLICSTALSSSDLNDVGNYLSDKWSISWTNV